MANVPGGISVLASIGSLYVDSTGDPAKGYDKLLVALGGCTAGDGCLAAQLGELTFKRRRAAQSKNAVLNSLAAVSSQESYGHAIEEFIGWYCSEPRLAFNRTVVPRYRFFLEQRNLAQATINVRLAAIRRLAYEASDTGLLSPDLAAGIRRVKARSGWA